MQATTDLLLACARSHLQDEHAQIIERSAQQILDWDELWKRSLKHGIAYFFGSHLRHLVEGAPDRMRLPQAFSEKIREQMRRFTAQGLRFLHHQLGLAEHFESHNLPVLWLKGLALSQQLYGRVEARCSSDLDLYARDEDASRIASCLRSLDFKPYQSQIPGKDEHPMGSHHDTWVHESDGQVVVEVHYRLSGPAACQPKVEDVIARARRFVLAGQPVLVPGIQDELLILCLHAHQHNFAMLRTLMDISEYVDRYQEQLDWSALFKAAAACGTKGRVHGALRVSRQVLGNREIPARLELTRWQRSMVDRLTPQEIAGASGDQNDVRRMGLTLLMDSWTDVGRLLLPHFLPPGAYVRAICPSPWNRVPGVARVYHLARLFWRAMGG